VSYMNLIVYTDLHSCFNGLNQTKTNHAENVDLKFFSSTVGMVFDVLAPEKEQHAQPSPTVSSAYTQIWPCYMKVI
jgi:hypothetical protein